MYTAITSAPIDTTALLERVGTRADGAALLFVGRVRDHNDGRPVRGMRYDAYSEMAERVLEEIGREARGRLEDLDPDLESAPAGTGSGTAHDAERGAEPRIAIVHRVGELEIGEASVAIAVASPHRAAAFDACRYVIEEIKKRLPVWKRERYIDGDEEWLEGEAPVERKAANA